MNLKDSLTNEKITKKFANQFDLVNHAIKLVENMIKSGRAARLHGFDPQNPALIVIEEIAEGRDFFEEIPKPQPAVQDHVETKSFKKTKGDSVLLEEKEEVTYRRMTRNNFKDEDKNKRARKKRKVLIEE